MNRAGREGRDDQREQRTKQEKEAGRKKKTIKERNDMKEGKI